MAVECKQFACENFKRDVSQGDNPEEIAGYCTSIGKNAVAGTVECPVHDVEAAE